MWSVTNITFRPTSISGRLGLSLPKVGGITGSEIRFRLSVSKNNFGEMLDTGMMEKYREVALQAAKEAGKVIGAAFHKPKNVEHKGKVDLVTETDRQCETLIMEMLKKEFPTHKFIGEEESSINGTSALTNEPTWMVDPLDGTTNFVHRFPFVCVSIGLAIDKEVVVGVVYNPILDELFSGQKGAGAFLNGNRISVSDEKDLGSALLATEIGTKRDPATVDRSTGIIKSLLFKVRSLRMGGSCALGLASVACGRLDCFYEAGFGGPWDVAAGALLVREAGGRVLDVSGAPFDVMARNVLATNAHLAADLAAAIDFEAWSAKEE